MTAMFVALAVGSALTALFAVVAWAREHWLVVTVVGQSMVPTLVDGQRVLARRPQRGQRFAIGDVVVFALPESLARQARAHRDVAYRVKRIVAVGGDPLPLPHALDRHSKAVGDWRILKRNARIPEGHFAVIGDAPGSEDSSHLGLVARDQILAWVPCLAYRDVRRRREPAWEEQAPAAPLSPPREPSTHRVSDQPDREELPVFVEGGRGTERETTIPVGCIRLMARRRGWRS
jgi:signal peptidase I